jgi:hypothetical protein
VPAVLAERATPPTTDRLAPVFMTRVGIAGSPAFRAGFLICEVKGFMVLSCQMRQQRAGGRRAVGTRAVTSSEMSMEPSNL